MFTSGGQAARSKNCRRQGSASQIGIDAQFDRKSVFIVQSRLVGKGARLARRAHATLVNAGKDAWARFALPTLRKKPQRSSNTSAWMEKFAPASVHVATGTHPDPRAKAVKYSSGYL